MDFTDEFQEFNGYYRYYSPLIGQKEFFVRYYFLPEELTPDMKKFIRGGLNILTEWGILSEFESNVLYLNKVEGMNQSDIVKLTNSTINIVKKASIRAVDKLRKNLDITRWAFFLDETYIYELTSIDEVGDQTEEIIEAEYGIRPAEESPEYLDWSKAWDEKYHILQTKKLGCTEEEFEKREQAMRKKICANLGSFKHDKIILFKLWGYMLVRWKLSRKE